MDLATLNRMHPEWNVVDFKVAPNGGIWALGADGGVFALDSTGGTTGITAPWLGAYSAEADAVRNDPNRRFTRLDLNQYGGYSLISANQEAYNYLAQASAPPVAAPIADTSGTTQATTGSVTAPAAASAEAAIHAVLDPIGLGALAGQALSALHGTPGADAAWISTVWLPQQQSYKDMFPEIAAAQQKASADPALGTYVPTPADILNYRNQAQEYVRQGLIPPELATKDNLSKLITGDVSIEEFRGRIENGWSRLVNGDPNAVQAFLDFHDATTPAQAVAWLLDPTLGEAAAQAAITQAEIGGRAVSSGFGSISASQATALRQAGQGTAAQFTRAALETALTGELTGETDDITQGTQVEAMTGDAAAVSQIDTRRVRRAAQFEGGGGAANTGGGRTGLG